MQRIKDGQNSDWVCGGQRRTKEQAFDDGQIEPLETEQRPHVDDHAGGRDREESAGSPTAMIPNETGPTLVRRPR